MTDGEIAPWTKRKKKLTVWRQKREPEFGNVCGVLLGAAASVLLFAPNPCARVTATADDRFSIYAAGVTVTGGLLGLTIAALALLADHLVKRPDDPPVQHGQAQVTDHHRTLIIDIFVALARASGASTILGVIGLFASWQPLVAATLVLWCMTLGVMVFHGAQSITLLKLVVLNRATSGHPPAAAG